MWPFRKNKVKKRAKNETKYVKICPRCQSFNIQISHQGSLSGLTALGLPTVYRCNNCGYRGYSFPEIDLNELKRKQKNKEHKDKRQHQK